MRNIIVHTPAAITKAAAIAHRGETKKNFDDEEVVTADAITGCGVLENTPARSAAAKSSINVSKSLIARSCYIIVAAIRPRRENYLCFFSMQLRNRSTIFAHFDRSVDSDKPSTAPASTHRRCMIAGNCVMMGLPAVTVTSAEMEELMKSVEENPQTVYTVDLQAKLLCYGERKIRFDIPDSYRSALMTGSWDSTSMLRANLDKVKVVAAKLPYMTGFRG